MKHSKVLFCLSLVGLLLLSSPPADAALSGVAAEKQQQTKDLLQLHAIRADRDGIALRTDQDAEDEFKEAFQAYVDRMLDEAERWSASSLNCTNGDQKPVVRLLIHVHGGLNDWGDTVDRMRLVSPIKNGENGVSGCSEDRYYPIFVAWPSGFCGAYMEHLFRLRQGNRVNFWNSILPTFPVALVADAAHGVVNMPIYWSRQISTLKDQMVFSTYAQNTNSSFGKWLSRNHKMAEQNSQRGDLISNYNFEDGDSSITRWQRFKKQSVALLTSPLRVTIGTFGQGQITASSWQVMRRRTSNLLYPPDSFEMGPKEMPLYPKLETYLPAERFFRTLLQRVQHNTNYQYKITFVGHSMGTMVLNQLFNVHRRDWIQSRAVENIIYMGAACSVSDCAQAIIPLLQGYEAAKAAKIPHFYNLTLHPLAEINEEMFWLTVPSGSLLHLIDSHLQSPNSPLERTMGSQVNVMSTIEVFKDVRDHCTFKCFDYKPGTLPVTHGDFSKSPFWRADFRTATSDRADLAEAKRRQQEDHVRRYSAPNFHPATKLGDNTYPLNWLEEYQPKPKPTAGQN